jgi:CRISPR-associated protein Cas1
MKLLPSQRGHLYVLERARIYQRDGRVEYAVDEGREPRSFNVPIANTSFLLIGPGSSITTEAVRLLKQEGVCIGFCGSGGTPLLSADDPYPDFLCPADEYRDPRPLRRWMDIATNSDRRVTAGRILLNYRLENIETLWPALPTIPQFFVPEAQFADLRRRLARIGSTEELLGLEGRLARELYKACAKPTGFADFKREPGRPRPREPIDPNALLDHGNYVAYGLASVVCWALGLPASLAVIHGQTRRGGLVFDVADVVKDAIVLPLAFATAHHSRTTPVTDTEFRSTLLDAFIDHGAMARMFEAIQAAIEAA